MRNNNSICDYYFEVFLIQKRGTKVIVCLLENLKTTESSIKVDGRRFNLVNK